MSSRLTDAEDQIREVLIHGSYMSPQDQDIELCINFGLVALEDDNREAMTPYASPTGLCRGMGKI